MKLLFASLSLFFAFAMSQSRTASSATPAGDEALCKVWTCESPESVWPNASLCEEHCDFACDVAFVC